MSTRADLALILVHYRTPELVPEAVEGPRSVRWLLVDNSGDPGDAEAFRQLGLEVLVPGKNLGYAGGVNLGAEAADAETLVFLNPDVRVRPGCLEALRSSLQTGAAAAGPAFFWDSALRLCLPPAEPRSRRWELRAARARESLRRAAAARRTWRAHARRHWRAEAPLPSPHLSGALLAISRTAWESVGPFDEGFRLYFEETDWLHRARRAGLTTTYVPAARAVHLFGRSSAKESRIEEWFEASRRRFFERDYGETFLRLLDDLPGPGEPSAEALELAAPLEIVDGVPSLELDPASGSRLGGAAWVEISPSSYGFPAAAERLGAEDLQRGRWSLPPTVWRGLAPGRYEVTLVSDDDPGLEAEHRSLEKPPA